MKWVKLPAVRLLLLTVVFVTVQRVRAQQVEVFDGQPTFTEGMSTGYYIWREGDLWHVRWTTTGTKRHFAGLVLAKSGDLKSLKRIDLESGTLVVRRGSRGGRPAVTRKEQDKVEKDGKQRIRFNSQNDGDIDGFDFKVDKNVMALRFTLEISGKAAHNRVEAGKNNQKMSETPFTVKLK